MPLGGGADDAGDVRAVAVHVGRILFVEDEIPAVLVGARLMPEVVFEIGMGGVDSGIDHRHDHLGAALGDFPGALGLDVGRKFQVIEPPVP